MNLVGDIYGTHVRFQVRFGNYLWPNVGSMDWYFHPKAAEDTNQCLINRSISRKKWRYDADIIN